MLDKAGIDQFYKDVEALGLKFPVAAIAGATGFSKGNVSDYLKKRREPSQGFLNKFYEKFSNSLKKVPKTDVTGTTDKDETIAILVRQGANFDALSKRLEALEKIARANHEILNRLTQSDEEILEERPAYSKRGTSPAAKK